MKSVGWTPPFLVGQQIFQLQDNVIIDIIGWGKYILLIGICLSAADYFYMYAPQDVPATFLSMREEAKSGEACPVGSATHYKGEGQFATPVTYLEDLAAGHKIYTCPLNRCLRGVHRWWNPFPVVTHRPSVQCMRRVSNMQHNAMQRLCLLLCLNKGMQFSFGLISNLTGS